MKIHILNFQSIEDVSFEIPEKSFTCIVGPSNIGKSAIRRALECLMYNNSDASFIRNGAKSCSIEVTFGDGSIIKWYRDKKTAGYIIDGDDFTKLAGSVPEVLLDKGYKELIINKDKYQVQIASQFNNIFLLNETGGKVTEVLSNLGNLNRIIKSNKSCQSDLKLNKNRLSVRREDIISAKEKLKSYKGLDEQRQLVSVLKTHLKAIKETKDKLNTIKKIETSLNKAVRLVKILRPTRDINVFSFELDLNKVTNIKNLLRKLNHTQELVNAYEPIKLVSSVILDISADNLKNLKALLPKLNLCETKQKHFSKLSEIQKIEFNLKEEYEQYLKMVTYSEKLEKVKNKIVLYKNLPNAIPLLEDIDISMLKKISALYGSASKTKEKVIYIRKCLTKLEVKLAKLIEEKDILHKTLGVCPLCDKEF